MEQIINEFISKNPQLIELQAHRDWELETGNETRQGYYDAYEVSDAIFDAAESATKKHYSSQFTEDQIDLMLEDADNEVFSYFMDLRDALDFAMQKASDALNAGDKS